MYVYVYLVCPTRFTPCYSVARLTDSRPVHTGSVPLKKRLVGRSLASSTTTGRTQLWSETCRLQRTMLRAFGIQMNLLSAFSVAEECAEVSFLTAQHSQYMYTRIHVFLMTIFTFTGPPSFIRIAGRSFSADSCSKGTGVIARITTARQEDCLETCQVVYDNVNRAGPVYARTSIKRS